MSRKMSLYALSIAARKGHRDQNGLTNFGKQTLLERFWPGFAAENITDPETGEIVVEAAYHDFRSALHVSSIRSDMDNIFVCSPMTCPKCAGHLPKRYGMDLATGQPAAMGVAVGIIAAQSIPVSRVHN